MAASGLVFRSDLVGTGRAISILLAINGVRNQRSHLVGPPFPEFKARFSATAGWHFSRDLTRRLPGTNSMAASGLVFRSDLVSTGRAISILLGINGVRNQRSHLVGPPFPEFKARFSATAGWHFSRDLTRVQTAWPRLGSCLEATWLALEGPFLSFLA